MKMNPKLRTIFIIIAVITIIVISVLIIPRALSIYYQTKGGQIVNRVIRESENISDIGLTCAELPPRKGTLKEKVQEGIAKLKLAERFDAGNTQIYYHLGRAYCLLGEPDKALTQFDTFTQLRPANPLGYIELGFAYEEIGDIESAKKSWQKAGISSAELYETGEDQFQSDHYKSALGWFERSILIDPSNSNAWMGLGRTYYELQDYESASNAFQEAWNINPETSTIQLIESMEKSGDVSAIEEILYHVLDSYPNSPHRLSWYQALGDYFSAQGNYNQAVDVYRHAIEEFPNESGLHLSLGWIYYNQGKDEIAALNEFRLAIRLNNKSGKGYFSLAKLLNLENRYEEASKYYLEAIERSPNNRWYYLAGANNARSAGNYSHAIELYLEAINRFPNFPNAYFLIAQVYRLTENYSRAIEAIDQAISLMDPPLSSYYSWAGEIYRLAGDIAKAHTYYNQALSLDPKNKMAREGLQMLDGE